jgi:basic membrane protein A
MAAVADPLNPYIAGSPVTDAKMFFGREDIFDWIRHSLSGQYADHILVIHGQRRVGKTSVLKQLPHRLPNRYIPVFFDLQGRTRTSLDRFLWWLAREIVRVLKQDRDLVLPLPDKEAFARDPEHLEGHFLPELRRRLPDHNLLLTFDEFDTLEEEEVRETLGRPLTETLRQLMGREGLNFIFSIGSSGRKLENMQASYTEFFKAALYKKVSFLGQQQAYDLISRPVEGVLAYQSEAVRAIYDITSGHPYFIQLVCHELFALCQRTGQGTVSADDVHGVLDEVVERGTVNLKFVWDEASDLEKWSLAGLAQSKGLPDSRGLGEYLRKERVRFSPPDLEAALIHLREKDVLTAENRFVNGLLRRWLQRNRPLEQVREELTEVNPIANRYIEIGLEYLESRQPEKAIESFQEALEVDADNLPALVHIGQVHLQQQAFAEAVSQFEQALVHDGEDVSARAGLCQAQLALGDQAAARGKLKEAQRSYQQILAINPEHTDARQRMADIYRQQAEKALADGKDEEALSAFGRALGFTPEDQALETRYQEVREEKKASILAALPAKARSLAASERWDEAFAAWQDYLSLQPPDPERAQAEIEGLKGEQALARTYAEAQAALGRRDYDQAIPILKGIVARDETYKESTRLLLQAIEARRRARPRWKWGGFHLSRNAWLRLAAGMAALALGAAVFVTWDQFIGAWIGGLGAAVPPAASEVKVCLLTEQLGVSDVYYAPIWGAIAAAQTAYGIEGVYAEGTDEANVVQRIEAFLGEGCDLVVSSWPFAEAMRSAAADHPEAGFVVLDTGFDSATPNLMGIQFKTWEVAFLAGYLAAGVTETGRVGTMGGMDIQAVTQYMDGFARGVEHYNRVHGTEVVILGREPALGTGLFIDTFTDAEAARKASEDLLDQGADVLFPITGLLTTASAAAAQERERAYVIGADLDWASAYPEYGDVLLCSAEVGYEEMLAEAIRRFVEGEFPGAVITGNLENGGVGLAPFHELESVVTAQLAAELAELRQAAPSLSVAIASTLTPPPTELAAAPPPTATAMAAAPLPSPTAGPSWITDFAEPILMAIAGRPPDFQDEFDDGSGGWYRDGYCGDWRMRIEDGELILANCGAHRDNIDYPDFVAEVEGRIFADPVGDAGWLVVFRDIRGPAYLVSVRPGGSVELGGFEGGFREFSGTAHDSYGTNHLLLIAKGSRFAFYINDQPLYYIEDDSFGWGEIWLRAHGGDEFEAGNPTYFAFDNFRIWDISDVSVP